MKKLFLFFWFLLCQFYSAFSTDVAELRKLYYEAANERRRADKFMKVMDGMPVDSDPLLLCYKGMAHLIQANFSFNPYNKLSFFTKGKEMLERAVNSDPENIEIRFMRFCVQTNAPFFLGYSNDVDSDKKFILNSLDKISDKDLKSKIIIYMLDTDHCTQTEKSKIK